MPLKEKFLSYVEMQRSANDCKDAYGIESEKTKEAYEKANQLKREILDALEHYNM